MSNRKYLYFLYSITLVTVILAIESLSASTVDRDFSIIDRGQILSPRLKANVHASTVLPLSEGRILCAYHGSITTQVTSKGKTEEESLRESGIFMSRGDFSKEGRITWHDPRLIVSEEEFVRAYQLSVWPDYSSIGLSNPVLSFFKGRLLLFFKAGPSIPQWSGFLYESFDQGDSWITQGPLTMAGRLEAILGPVKNKPFVVGGEILLAPSSREFSSKRPTLTTEVDYSCIDYTEDGVRWDTVRIAKRNPWTRLIQPTLVRGKGKNILAFCRERAPSNRNPFGKTYIHRAVSVTEGREWSYFEHTSILTCDSGLDAVELGKGNIAIVYNKRQFGIRLWNFMDGLRFLRE